LLAAARSSTSLFGKAPLGPVLRHAISTIRTIIRHTTQRVIYLRFPSGNTASSAIRNGSRAGRFISPITQEPKPQSGTDPKKDASGTDATPSASRAGRSGSEKNGPASIAARWFRWLSALTGIQRSTARRNAAWLRCTSVEPLLETADVCCIHVPDGEWFSLANGAVVHNSHGSDAYQTLAVMAKPPVKAPPRTPARSAPVGDRSWMA